MCNVDPIVSVIVPVYNAEKRLKKCIDSILRQSFREYELILVNDGSCDSSGDICAEAANNDSRVIVIHKGNGGVSSARNAGLGVARGKYVTFIDSDDEIDCCFLEHAIDKLEESGAEGYYSGLSMETWKNDVVEKQNLYTFTLEGILSVKEVFENLNVSFPPICICGPCCKLFKREILSKNNICFDEKMSLGEDTMFNLLFFSHCTSIYMSKWCDYHYYRGNADSLFTKLDKNIYEIHVQVYGKMRDVMLENKCSATSIRRFDEMYVELMIGCIHKFFQHKKESTVDERKKIIRDVSKNSCIRKMTSYHGGISVKVELWLLQHSFIYVLYILFAVRYA